jgi:hypothetical protein
MADEFRQYAEEALRGAERSKIAQEKQALIGLARTRAEAAVQIGSTPVRREKPHGQNQS